MTIDLSILLLYLRHRPPTNLKRNTIAVKAIKDRYTIASPSALQVAAIIDTAARLINAAAITVI